MFYKKYLGQRGENIALKYYQGLGFRLIKQNFYTRYGELDLVLEKPAPQVPGKAGENNEILIVEVKTRRNNHFGWGEEAINHKKIANIQSSYQILQLKEGLPNDYQLEICVVEILNNNINIRRFEI